MNVQAVKNQIAEMTATELADVEAFIHGLLSDRNQADSTQPGLTFEEAAHHVRSDYKHLLHKLSQ